MAEAHIASVLPVAGGVTVSAVFGGMVLFALVYAPLVFAKLPAAAAGPFIRAVFPIYYKVMGSAALLAGLLLLPSGEGFAMAAVGAGFFLVMLLLMPRINVARDASLAEPGTGGSGKRFSALHRLSVFINFIQMLVVLAVLVRLLA